MMTASRRPSVLALTGLVLCGLLALPRAARAEASPRAEFIAALATTIASKYQDAERATATAEALRKAEAAGRFANLQRPDELAAALSKFLSDFDRHFHVQHDPLAPGEKEEKPGHDDPDIYLRRTRHANFGFERVERLSANVGYLRLRYFDNPNLAGETAAAAMAFLAGTDAMIIDLRRNGGGNPGMVQFLASYFFEDSITHLNSMYWRSTDSTRQLWTLPFVPGPRRPKVPVYILTSRATGSAAEAFGYHMKALERATLVGTRTAGAANPGDVFRVGDFTVFISTGRAINPVTKSNWEITGVIPDVEVPAEDALDEALLRIWTQLRKAATDEDRKRELDWALEEARVLRAPVTLGAKAQRSFVGVYGVNEIALTKGQLRFKRRERAPIELIALGGDRFMPRGQSDFRLVLDRNAQGRIIRLHAQWSSGHVETSARE